MPCSNPPPDVSQGEWQELLDLYQEYKSTHKTTERTFELLRATGLDQLAITLGRDLAAEFPNKTFIEIDEMVQSQICSVIASHT